ncbi:unnamed protein product [Spirodela intermedia]|uniref:glucan endo-1,3-beta-D-glucosidase n=1 Tax=Spirodela intermedia TaxID=51605 RepID=A0A7I8L270_SPIIN|nr:unnamed protein product [Spirodela intermedia]
MLSKECGAVLLLLIIFALLDVSGSFVGVNINTDSPGVPSASELVLILRSRGIHHVRLLAPDHQLLSALANTGIQVMVSIPNNHLLRVGLSQTAAATWLNDNVAAFLPVTNITYIAVGSEVLTVVPNAALILLPAMKFLQAALIAADLSRQVKISTPQSMALIPTPFPPSAAAFNSTWVPIMSGLLQFLKNTSSSFMLNAKPYYGYTLGNGIFPLDYALFRQQPQTNRIIDPNTNSAYSSMFDAMVDAAYYSMKALNFSEIPVMVTETGWPWLGRQGEPDATADNALTYNSNLIRRISSMAGTPAQPNRTTNAYIYELFDGEDLQDGQPSGRHWGLFFTNGTLVYSLDLGGLEAADTTSSLTRVYCIADSGADPQALEVGLNWACGPGSANCTAIQPGQPCYTSSIAAIASYAYNDYYRKAHVAGGTCDFGGTARTTTADPSYGSCIFEGSLGSRTTNGSSSGTSGISSGGGGSIAPTAFGPAGPINGVLRLGAPRAKAFLMVLFLVMML